jgi:hypothetical protein
MVGSEVAAFNFLVEMTALLTPKFPEGRFAEICELGSHILMHSKVEPGFPVQLTRNVVNRRIRYPRKPKSASARKDRPGFLIGFQKAVNYTLSPMQPRADFDGSESVHVMVENLDLVVPAEWFDSSHLELVNGS